MIIYDNEITILYGNDLYRVLSGTNCVQAKKVKSQLFKGWSPFKN